MPLPLQPCTFPPLWLLFPVVRVQARRNQITDHAQRIQCLLADRQQHASVIAASGAIKIANRKDAGLACDWTEGMERNGGGWRGIYLWRGGR